MEKPVASFDPETVAHTVKLFAEKRALLTADAIWAVTMDVIGHLAKTAPTPKSIVMPASGPVPLEEPDIDEERLNAFCDTLISPYPDQALAFLAEFQAEGLARYKIYDLIGAAARRLGEGWDDDRLTFVDVTIGTGHLYALLRAMQVEDVRQLSFAQPQKHALFATVPNECHSVGVTIAANVFREAGWQVDLEVGLDHETLVEQVNRRTPNVIGLTLSTNERLEDLARVIVAIRINAPTAIIGIGQGGEVETDQLKAIVDFDLIFTDINIALRDLEDMLREQSVANTPIIE
ncbi:MAG: cobalamin-dependent protein [Pseudomonadota bacterium]